MRRASARPALRARTRGVIALELALVALILVPLIIGVVEFGRAVYAHDVMVKSVRSAARYLVVGAPEDATRQLEAKCIAVTGSPAASAGACSGTPLLVGLTIGMVTILEPTTSNGVKLIATGSGTMDVVTVYISGYPLSTLGSAIFPDLTFGAIGATLPYVFF
jgi:Flp pilus assembly protein TadG